MASAAARSMSLSIEDPAALIAPLLYQPQFLIVFAACALVHLLRLDTWDLAQTMRPGRMVVAAAALNSDSPAPSQAFLDRFPASDQARTIRSHLARIVYRKLPDLQVDLESFVQRFRGTPSGREALKRLEVLLETELRRNPSEDLLRQFESRFPKSGRLAALEALVKRVRWDRRLAEWLCCWLSGGRECGLWGLRQDRQGCRFHNGGGTRAGKREWESCWRQSNPLRIR